MRGILLLGTADDLLSTADDLVEDTTDIEVGVLQVCKKKSVSRGVVNERGLVLKRASWGTELRGDAGKTESALCVAGAPPKSRSTQDGSIAISKVSNAPSSAGGATNASKSNNAVNAGHSYCNYNNFLNIVYRRFLSIIRYSKELETQ